jgi:hypothetical protein
VAHWNGDHGGGTGVNGYASRGLVRLALVLGEGSGPL